jgi:hypothetical protein
MCQVQMANVQYRTFPMMPIQIQAWQCMIALVILVSQDGGRLVEQARVHLNGQQFSLLDFLRQTTTSIKLQSQQAILLTSAT